MSEYAKLKQQVALHGFGMSVARSLRLNTTRSQRAEWFKKARTGATWLPVGFFKHFGF